MTASGEDHSASLEATREYCDAVVTVENDRAGMSLRQKRALQLRSLASLHSYERLVYHRSAFQSALDALVERNSYDIVTAEFAQMANYHLPLGTRRVLDEHNIEYDVLLRTSVGETSLRRRVYNHVNYLKLRREERRAWRSYDGCVVTSPRDRALLQRDRPDVLSAVVPNGVDTSFFCPQDVRPDVRTILFFGAIDYYPNTDGLLFFLREVMPLLRKQAAPVRLIIVGKSAPDCILREASADVQITGYVDDVRPYLGTASVVIAPIRVGGGTRLKILEAMAMGKAVVSTTLGAEGIAVTHQRDILLADGAEAFAAAIARLLDDSELSESLGYAARRLVEHNYDWRVSVQALEQFYRRIVTSSLDDRH
jgi:polysaccharide biosynthesis protein PslH